MGAVTAEAVAAAEVGKAAVGNPAKNAPSVKKRKAAVVDAEIGIDL